MCKITEGLNLNYSSIWVEKIYMVHTQSFDKKQNIMGYIIHTKAVDRKQEKHTHCYDNILGSTVRIVCNIVLNMHIYTERGRVLANNKGVLTLEYYFYAKLRLIVRYLTFLINLIVHFA